eukprot:GHVU01026282.1.p2 GENE.GHVU01026282.1~~GHVU01026282.1.p2  ORF type:complete len:103 (+),score=20.66 GHVU01026282.1:469-777(+)
MRQRRGDWKISLKQGRSTRVYARANWARTAITVTLDILADSLKEMDLCVKQMEKEEIELAKILPTKASVETRIADLDLELKKKKEALTSVRNLVSTARSRDC